MDMLCCGMCVFINCFNKDRLNIIKIIKNAISKKK